MKLIGPIERWFINPVAILGITPALWLLWNADFHIDVLPAVVFKTSLTLMAVSSALKWLIQVIEGYRT